MVSTTIIYKERVSHVANAMARGDDLWLPVEELPASTGWELRPEGVCLGDVCVPLPAGCEREFITPDGRMFNLGALYRLLGQPLVHDATHSVWACGEGAAAHTSALRSSEAPNFTLPDLEGHPHSLSDYRGKKVVLTAWASW